MKKTFWAACAVLLVLSGATRASDPVGIYALVDKVILEPNQETPQRIRIWGTFAVAAQEKGDSYKPVEHGYMYFAIVRDQERQCRVEWADLKKAAGTGQIIAFGSRYQARSGLNYRVRKAQTPSEPVRHIDNRRVQKLIKDLDHDGFAVRENASKELKKFGDSAKPALKAALKGETKPEVRRRLESLLESETPDSYSLGFGLTKARADSNYQPIKELISFPAPVSPIESDRPEPGRVTLVVRNILDKTRGSVRYVFEIENALGAKEASPEVAAGEKETSWSPAMHTKPGEKNTWRVWATDGNWKSPVSSAAFRTKSTR